MTAKSHSIRSRNKPVVVDILDTAEWDIADYNVPDVLLDVIGRALAAVPVSDRDLVVGTIRYRSFTPFILMFHYPTPILDKGGVARVSGTDISVIQDRITYNTIGPAHVDVYHRSLLLHR